MGWDLEQGILSLAAGRPSIPYSPSFLPSLALPLKKTGYFLEGYTFRNIRN